MQHIEVFRAFHCHQYSCALWQHFAADPALRDSKPFPEVTGVGIVFPDLKPAIQMSLKYIKMRFTMGCLS